MAPSPASPIPSLAFEAAMADEGEEGDDGKGEYVAPPRWMRPRSAPAKPRETPESPATTRPGSASSIRRAKAARAKNERRLKRNGSDYGVRCGSGRRVRRLAPAAINHLVQLLGRAGRYARLIATAAH